MTAIGEDFWPQSVKSNSKYDSHALIFATDRSDVVEAGEIKKKIKK